MRGLLRAITISLSTTACVIACSSSSTSSTSSTTTFGDADCTQCVNTTCAAQRSTCDASAECKAFTTCLYACPSGSTTDGACSRRCTQPSAADGKSALAALLTCGNGASATSSCSARCAADNGWSATLDGGPANTSDGSTTLDGASTTDAAATAYKDSTCGMCVLTTCSNQFTTCTANAECSTWAVCIGKCPLSGKQVDAACFMGCSVPTSTAGHAAYQPLYNCATQASGGACKASCQ